MSLTGRVVVDALLLVLAINSREVQVALAAPQASQFRCFDVDNQNSCVKGMFCNHAGGADLDGDGAVGYCDACPTGNEPEDMCDDLSLTQAGADRCAKWCKDRSGQECSRDLPCTQGTFCDFENGDAGYCQVCTDFPTTRLEDEFSSFLFTECFDSNLTEGGAQSCFSLCFAECFPTNRIYGSVDGEEYPVGTVFGADDASTTGPLVDCGNGLTTCLGAEKAVCLMNLGQAKSYFNRHELVSKMISKCKEGGGIAAMIFDSVKVLSQPRWIAFLPEEPGIPFAFLTSEDGQQVLDNKLGSVASISVKLQGEACIWPTGCTDAYPCPEGEFCNYDLENRGFCETCPEEKKDNLLGNCFNDYLPQKGVENCASVCTVGKYISFPECKLCPKDVSSSMFGGGGEKCEFCPNNDMKYPDREVRMFGPGVTCLHVNFFFEHYHVNADHQNCQLAQMMSYICGCEGSGYAGANSDAKRKVLVWLPRISAFLSFVGSTLIIVDVLRENRRRQDTANQLMVALSVFDLFGSAAYALTSLPISEIDYMYGSRGNDETCTTQGFFIQMGAIAAYLNVSLATYYFVVIKLSWQETQLSKLKPYLFICPVLFGLTFAFAGIPFYDNMILWCNNSAHYWPEIPVAVAIFFATILMGAMFWHVYQQEKTSSRWRMGGNSGGGGNLSSSFFWQATWYLLAFYLTWPPYLVLQHLWSSGEAFSKYGFVLFAGTAIPLQGFWNFLVHRRRKMQNGFAGIWRAASPLLRKTLSMRSLGFSFRHSSRNSSQKYQASIRTNAERPVQFEGEECNKDNVVNAEIGVVLESENAECTESPCVENQEENDEERDAQKEEPSE